MSSKKVFVKEVKYLGTHISAVKDFYVSMDRIENTI